MIVLHIENSVLIKTIVRRTVESMDMTYLSCEVEKNDISRDVLEHVSLIITAVENISSNLKKMVFNIRKQTTRDIPILVVSAKDSIGIRRKLFSFGIIDFIIKDHQLELNLKDYLISFRSKFEFDDLLKKQRIAVIDDSKVSLNAIERAFVSNEIKNVDYYKDGESYLLHEEEYDIFIVDLILPGISGRALFNLIREKCPRAVIILITSSDNYIAVSNMMVLGIDECIFKPFSYQIFIARLRNQLKIKQSFINLDIKIKELEYMSTHDSLTQLLNRGAITCYIKDLKEKNKSTEVVSIIMLDIDNFKTINDMYGHSVGDSTLRIIGAKITNLIRESDFAARFGGEEFIIVLPNTVYEDAIMIGNRIQKALCTSIQTKEGPLEITVSGGVSTGYVDSIYQVIETADQLLYKAKSRGKNCIEF